MSSNLDGRPKGLVKLSGTVSNYKVTRESANFVFTESDKTRLGVVAIVAGIAGLSGQAISSASSVSAEEGADYVEFELGETPVRGWVWRSPFAEGHVVDVAAEWQGDHYEAGGIARPIDRTIALYPHCSRGTVSHIYNAVKWGGAFLLIFLVIFEIAGVSIRGQDRAISSLLSPAHLWSIAGIVAFFFLMTFSMTRKWFVFVRLAEKVFRTLDLPGPGNIDLVKSSKALRKPNDPGEYGTFYFRY